MTGQCKGRSVFSCGGSYPFSAVLVTQQTLGLPGDEVDRAAEALFGIVHHRIQIGQPQFEVVAIVGQLVVHFVFGGIHFEQPVEAPFGFVQYVGNAIGPRVAIGTVGVAKRTWILLVGKQHLVGSISRGCHVLQIIGSVVPAA